MTKNRAKNYWIAEKPLYICVPYDCYSRALISFYSWKLSVESVKKFYDWKLLIEGVKKSLWLTIINRGRLEAFMTENHQKRAWRSF